MALTDAQITDCRRFMGYQLSGTTDPVTDNWDIVYLVFGMRQMSLHTRLGNLSAPEEAVLVNTYLVNLTALESAIITASDNLDTDVASVWTHNKQEVADRTGLFDMWRRRLCGFLGCAPGPALGDGGMSLVRC